MSDTPRDALKDLIRAYGPDLLKYPNRVDSMLRSMCPDDDKEVRIIVFLTSRGLPMELLSAAEPGPVQDNYMMLLTWQMGYNEATALWGIKAWAYALDIDLPEWRRPEMAPAVVSKKPRDVVKLEPDRHPQKPERISMPKAKAMPDVTYVEETRKPQKWERVHKEMLASAPQFNFDRDRVLLLYSFCISFILTFLLAQLLLIPKLSILSGILSYVTYAFMLLIATPILSIVLVILYNRFTKAHLYVSDLPGPMFNYDDLKIGAIAAVLLIFGMIMSNVIMTSLLFIKVSENYIPLTGGAFLSVVIVFAYVYSKNIYMPIFLGLFLSMVDIVVRMINNNGSFLGLSALYVAAALILYVALRKLGDKKPGLSAIIAMSALFSLSLIVINQVIMVYYQAALIDGPLAINLVITAVLSAAYVVLWSVLLMAETTIRARIP